MSTSSFTTGAFTAPLQIRHNVLPFPKPYGRLFINEPHPPWVSEVMDQLNRLGELPAGWDGYGARPVRFENANFALRMLEQICGETAPTPQIVPGTTGDLQIEWHEEGGDIELHVRAPNDVAGWRFGPTTGDDGEEMAFRTNFARAADWIDEMMEPVGAPAAQAQ